MTQYNNSDVDVDNGGQVPDSRPMTEAELVDSLSELLRRYHLEGETNTDGLYPLRNDDPSVPDWDVYVVRLPNKADEA